MERGKGNIVFFVTIINSVAFSNSLIMYESSNHKNSGEGFTMMNLGIEESDKKMKNQRISTVIPD